MPDFSAPPPGWAVGGGPGNPPAIVGPGGMNQPPPQSVQMPPRIQQITQTRLPMPSHHVPHPQMIQQPPPVGSSNPNFQGYAPSYQYPPPPGVSIVPPPIGGPIHHPSDRFVILVDF